jgi:hypothetical protein
LLRSAEKDVQRLQHERGRVKQAVTTAVDAYVHLFAYLGGAKSLHQPPCQTVSYSAVWRRRAHGSDHMGAVLQQHHEVEEGVPGAASGGPGACVTPRSAMRLVAARPMLAPGEISRGEWIAPLSGWPYSRRQAALRRLAFGKCTVTVAECVLPSVVVSWHKARVHVPAGLTSLPHVHVRQLLWLGTPCRLPGACLACALCVQGFCFTSVSDRTRCRLSRILTSPRLSRRTYKAKTPAVDPLHAGLAAVCAPASVHAALFYASSAET